MVCPFELLKTDDLIFSYTLHWDWMSELSFPHVGCNVEVANQCSCAGIMHENADCHFIMLNGEHATSLYILFMCSFFFFAKSSLHTDDHFQWWFLDAVGTQLVKIDSFEIWWPSFLTTIFNDGFWMWLGMESRDQQFWNLMAKFFYCWLIFVGFLWLELCLAAPMMPFAIVSSKLQVSATIWARR